MDSLTLFGLLAVTAMLVFYALEDHSTWFVLAFAGACALASSTVSCKAHDRSALWRPFWAVVAMRRWRKSLSC
jgi:hypothetical protein